MRGKLYFLKQDESSSSKYFLLVDKRFLFLQREKISAAKNISQRQLNCLLLEKRISFCWEYKIFLRVEDIFCCKNIFFLTQKINLLECKIVQLLKIDKTKNLANNMYFKIFRATSCSLQYISVTYWFACNRSITFHRFV